MNNNTNNQNGSDNSGQQLNGIYQVPVQPIEMNGQPIQPQQGVSQQSVQQAQVVQPVQQVQPVQPVQQVTVQPIQQVPQQSQQLPLINNQSPPTFQPQVVSQQPRVGNQMVNQVQLQPSTPSVDNDGNNNLNQNVGNNIPPEEPRGTKFKRILMVLFFIVLFAFVYFLPNITESINNLKNKEKTVKEEDIITGKLNCSLSTTTENLNVSIVANFNFTDKKIKTLTFITEHSGEAGHDEADIAKLKNECALLKQNITALEGVNVTCNSGNVTTKTSQYFDYQTLKIAEVEKAYTDAGVDYPGFELNQNVDSVKKNMESSKYSCEITK